MTKFNTYKEKKRIKDSGFDDEVFEVKGGRPINTVELNKIFRRNLSAFEQKQLALSQKQEITKAQQDAITRANFAKLQGTEAKKNRWTPQQLEQIKKAMMLYKKQRGLLGRGKYNAIANEDQPRDSKGRFDFK
jgi:hypothetical protein